MYVCTNIRCTRKQYHCTDSSHSLSLSLYNNIIVCFRVILLILPSLKKYRFIISQFVIVSICDDRIFRVPTSDSK